MEQTETKPITGECKHCQAPVQGRASYCSGKCRTAHSRASVTDKQAPTVTNGSVTEPVDVTVAGPSITHYNSNPSKYVTRTNPHLLNWGKHMTGEQLAHNGLVANRVPIPGDWDYKGVATETDKPRGFGPEKAKVDKLKAFNVMKGTNEQVMAAITGKDIPESTRARGGAGEGGGGYES